MRLNDIGPDDREYGLQRTIDGRLVEEGEIDILAHVAEELKRGWEKAKADYDFPSNAVPEWRISWYYVSRKP